MDLKSRNRKADQLESEIIGVQFHPESILTQDGKKILASFLELGT